MSKEGRWGSNVVGKKAVVPCDFVSTETLYPITYTYDQPTPLLFFSSEKAEGADCPPQLFLHSTA